MNTCSTIDTKIDRRTSSSGRGLHQKEVIQDKHVRCVVVVSNIIRQGLPTKSDDRTDEGSGNSGRLMLVRSDNSCISTRQYESLIFLHMK